MEGDAMEEISSGSFEFNPPGFPPQLSNLAGVRASSGYNSRRLEGSRRIRGKGLTQLHLLTTHDQPARSSCRLSADPGDCMENSRGKESTGPSESGSSAASGESAACCA